MVGSAVVASEACGGSGEAVLVRGSKMITEVGHGLFGLGFLAPVTAREFKQSCFVDQVISDANDLSGREGLVTGSCKCDSFI